MAEIDLGQIKTPSSPLQAVNAVDDAPPDATHPGAGRTDLIHQESLNQEANRELRKTYASKAHELACACIAFWIITLGAVATVNAVTGRQILSDAVLIAVTTGVTVNVLAAFLGVIRGLFPSDGKGKNSN